jgi:hypothetical protein
MADLERVRLIFASAIHAGRVTVHLAECDGHETHCVYSRKSASCKAQLPRPIAQRRCSERAAEPVTAADEVEA